MTVPRSLCARFPGLAQEHSSLLTDFLLFKRDLPQKQGRKPPGHVLKVATWLVFTMLSQALR